MKLYFFNSSAYSAIPRSVQFRAMLDDFAELLSNDLPLPEIANRLDITQGTACVLLSRLCAEFGERAL